MHTIHPFSPLSLPYSPLLPLSAAPVPAGNSGAYFIYEAGGRIDNLQRRYVNAASRTLAVPLFPLPPWRRMGEEKGRMMEENRGGARVLSGVDRSEKCSGIGRFPSPAARKRGHVADTRLSSSQLSFSL